MRHALMFLGVALAASLLGIGCENRTNFVPLCATDQECVDKNGGRPNWVCIKEGRCACTDDPACGVQEHCEPRPGGDGYCHPDTFCEWNGDCKTGEFCDIGSNICRFSGCTIDLQCSIGEVCDQITSTCIKGCRTDGDCSYRDVCLCEDENGALGACKYDKCDPTTEEGRLGCGVGACHADTCVDDSHCEWAQTCEPHPDPEQELKVCEDDERGPFCGVCKQGVGSLDRCGANGNFCLRGGGDVRTFCGVNCVNGESCPNGFSCSDILIPTDGDCFSNDDCRPPLVGPTCDVDGDCHGGRCVEGKCAGSCYGRESEPVGWCSCVTDDQCPSQTCQNGVCSVTGRRCNDPGDCEGEIVCQRETTPTGETIGYCKVGENCAPEEGVSCLEVREHRGVR